MSATRRLKARVMVHRIPIAVPVRTSFGTMHDRPSVVLRLENRDGFAGWGEVWCNFPAVGAEHRARLLASLILPLAAQIGWDHAPSALWQELTKRLRVLALQTGEAGPLSQCAAGLECALHDLAARRAGKPLFALLNPRADPAVAVYASGINPDQVADVVERSLAAGHTAVKVKVGFGSDRDAANLRIARTMLGPTLSLMADANQGWTSSAAMELADAMADGNLTWIEEPLPHDAPDDAWRHLADALRIPFAAGENFTNATEFDTLPGERRLQVIQPDLGKWGGVGQSLRIAQAAEAVGRTYCPHWLGSGVGLLASLHVKAAAGGAGPVEVDVNPNPMREALSQSVFETLSGGRVALPTSSGIGEIDSVVEGFEQHLVWSWEGEI